MSTSSQYTDLNPYQSPILAAQVIAPSPPLPTYCFVMAIIDLVLLGLRSILVVAGIVGIFVAPEDQMVLQTGMFEVGSGLIMVLAGLTANIGMLMKKSWAVPFGYIKTFAALTSIGVAVWQLSMVAPNFPVGSPEFIGFMIGVAISLGIRGGLIIAYFVALVKFASWARTKAMNAKTSLSL